MIAERQLTIIGPARTRIRVRIYEPELNAPDAEDREIPWTCAIELDGMPPIPGFPLRIQFGQGFDSLDALLNAFYTVRCVLDASARKLGMQCVWPQVEDDEGGHGIPMPIMTHLGPAFEEEMIALMNQRQLEFILRGRASAQDTRDFDSSADNEDNPS